MDSQVEGAEEERSKLWADDRLVIQWIMQFTEGGQEGNSFQRELSVSAYLLLTLLPFYACPSLFEPV